MQKILVFHTKELDILLTPAAEQKSKTLSSTLLVEIQIYFSCLLGKRLAFYSASSAEKIDGTYSVNAEIFSDILTDSQKLTDNINIRFNTVMTKSCAVSDHAGPPPVTDFKIANQKPYVPSWLTIDFKNGVWSGVYGWDTDNRKLSNIKLINA